MNFIITFFIYISIVFGISMMLSGVYAYLQLQRLGYWLKKNKYERWKDLTTSETQFGEVGPGMGNTKKMWNYFYSDLDNEIEKILRLKDSFKIGLRYMGIFVGALLFTIVIIVTLIFIKGK